MKKVKNIKKNCVEIYKKMSDLIDTLKWWEGDKRDSELIYIWM